MTSFLFTLIAIILGAASAFSFAPYGYIILGFIPLSLLLFLLYKAPSWRIAIWLFVVYSFTKFISSLYWVSDAPKIFDASLHVFSIFTLLGLPAAITFIVTLPMGLLLWYYKKYPFFLMPIALSLGEYLLAWVFNGFPWNLHAHQITANITLAQSLSLFGQYMLGLLLILSAEILVFACVRKNYKILLLLLIWPLLYGYGWWRLEQAPEDTTSYKVRLVQANIPQQHKWDAAYFNQFLERYIKMSFHDDAKGINAIIWPEMALTQDITQYPYLRKIATILLHQNQYLITGGVQYDKGNERYYNSLFMLDDSQNIIDFYQKTHLVPFGEYVPFSDYLPLQDLSLSYLPNLSAGDGITLMQPANMASFVPLICFEAIFPAYAMQARMLGADFLLNVTNDAWFGNSIGPKQHLHLASLRAIETGLPLVRAAVTGISASIDSYGRVIDALPVNTQISQDVSIAKKIANPPLYFFVREYGYLLLLLVLLITGNIYYYKRER